MYLLGCSKRFFIPPAGGAVIPRLLSIIYYGGVPLKINIYCPVCAKRGTKKKLLEVDYNAHGKIYPWCKMDKQNVEVDLDKINKDLCLCADND